MNLTLIPQLFILRNRNVVSMTTTSKVVARTQTHTHTHIHTERNYETFPHTWEVIMVIFSTD